LGHEGVEEWIATAGQEEKKVGKWLEEGLKSAKAD
jgi:hypothetical protein